MEPHWGENAPLPKSCSAQEPRAHITLFQHSNLSGSANDCGS